MSLDTIKTISIQILTNQNPTFMMIGIVAISLFFAVSVALVVFALILAHVREGKRRRDNRR